MAPPPQVRVEGLTDPDPTSQQHSLVGSREAENLGRLPNSCLGVPESTTRRWDSGIASSACSTTAFASAVRKVASGSARSRHREVLPVPVGLESAPERVVARRRRRRLPPGRPCSTGTASAPSRRACGCGSRGSRTPTNGSASFIGGMPRMTASQVSCGFLDHGVVAGERPREARRAGRYAVPRRGGRTRFVTRAQARRSRRRTRSDGNSTAGLPREGTHRITSATCLRAPGDATAHQAGPAAAGRGHHCDGGRAGSKSWNRRGDDEAQRFHLGGLLQSYARSFRRRNGGNIGDFRDSARSAQPPSTSARQRPLAHADVPSPP